MNIVVGSKVSLKKMQILYDRVVQSYAVDVQVIGRVEESGKKELLIKLKNEELVF